MKKPWPKLISSRPWFLELLAAFAAASLVSDQTSLAVLEVKYLLATTFGLEVDIRFVN